MALFQTTRWSLVAGTRTPPGQAREALEELCRIYRPPVLAYIRSHVHSGTESEDLAQAFFESLLRHHTIARADPARGRFRVFLLTALRRFLSDQITYKRAAKRGGNVKTLAVDADSVGCDDDGPEQAFDRNYALTVIAHAVLRLEQEASEAGKLAMFESLREFLLESPDHHDYVELAQRLNLRSNTIAVAIHRLRSRLRELVHDAISDTVGSDATLASEQQTLRHALGAAGDFIDILAATDTETPP